MAIHTGENQFYIFGAGANGKELLHLLDAAGISVKAFIDNAEEKWGTKIETLECISLREALQNGAKDSIILISTGDDEQIRKQLTEADCKKTVRMDPWLKWQRKRNYFEPVISERTDYEQAVPFNHYESPYPDIREIHQKEKELFDTKKQILDIDFNVGRQLELFNQMKEIEMPGWKTDETAGSSDRYHYKNPWFAKGSADALYYMIRLLHPQNIIEVGSGYSTAVMLDVNEKHFANKIALTSIEPNAQRLRSLLRLGDNLEIYEKNLQEIPVMFFEKLKENDILFIDSSHVSKTGSDVNYVLFEILPRLQTGVYIHFHDIFYPFIYPKKWIYEGRAYNEGYMLRAFLMNNREYSIQLFGEMISAVYSDKIEERLHGCGVGSLWIKKENKSK